MHTELITRIIEKLVMNAVGGAWPKQRCKYCQGKSNGYADSQGFEHEKDCVVNDVRQLTWEVTNNL
jgi:hypothetical protein